MFYLSVLSGYYIIT